MCLYVCSRLSEVLIILWSVVEIMKSTFKVLMPAIVMLDAGWGGGGWMDGRIVEWMKGWMDE